MARLLALLLGTTIGALICATAWWVRHRPTPMQDVELSVVDTRGAPLENFRWSYFDETPGAVVSPYVPQGVHPLGVATARVPQHRISIDIEAKGLQRARFGPFEQDAMPPRIKAVLADLQVVAGRVTHAGQPIAGAAVELLMEAPDIVEGLASGFFSTFDDLRATTDERGTFRIASESERMPYFVRAWKQGYAPSTVGPVHVGGAPIDVALHDGGAIEGVLHPRDDRSVDNVELELYREEAAHDDTSAERGERFFAHAEHDGRFRFEHVDVGPWLVRVRGASRVDRLPFVVEVTEGATTQLDMDLTRPPIQIDGRLTLNGEPFSHARPSLLLIGAKALCIDSTPIDGDERFILLTRAPGKYRLLVEGNHHHDVRQPRRISDLIEVPASGAHWQHDIVRGPNDPDEIVLDSKR